MSKYLELVEGSFTQEHFDKQTSQNPYVAYSIQDDKVIYSIVPNEEGTMYTVYRVVSKDISNCTYNMVDLGLSVKWADRNVGATSPEHYGSYFQWGDINAYTYDGAGEITAAKLAEMLNPMLGPQLGMEITADNVGDILEMIGITSTDLTNTPMGSLVFSLDKEFNWDSYNEVDVITGWEEDEDGYRYPTSFKKYNNGENSLKVLESSDDATTVHMGTQYRMPTSAEIQELISGTTQTFIDVDGNEFSKEQAENEVIKYGKLKGVRFTGSNGNNIFIPAAGSGDEILCGSIGQYGYLWSSSLKDSLDDNANFLSFDYHGFVSLDFTSRCWGRPIRGVQA